MYEKLSDGDRALLRVAAGTAMEVQDACNLGGVLNSMADMCAFLWVLARKYNFGGTDWVNQHPIMQMYASKVQHLAFNNDETLTGFSAAYDHVEALKNDQEPEEPK